MNKNKLAQVFHFDLYGKRENKYTFLKENSLKNIKWNDLDYSAPNYFLVKKDFIGSNEYELGFKVDELFVKYSSGIHTGKDHLVIDFEKEILFNRIQEVKNTLNENLIRSKYELEDTSGWNLNKFKSTENNIKNYVKLKFRVFDDRWIIYENRALKRDRSKIMDHFFKRDNLGLVTIRRSRSNDIWKYVFVSNIMTTEPTTITSLDNNYLFPLYLYPDENEQQSIETTQSYGHPSKGVESRRPNLNMDIVNKISESLGLTFVPEKIDLNSPPMEEWLAKQDEVVLNSTILAKQDEVVLNSALLAKQDEVVLNSTMLAKQDEVVLNSTMLAKQDEVVLNSTMLAKQDEVVLNSTMLAKQDEVVLNSTMLAKQDEVVLNSDLEKPPRPTDTPPQEGNFKKRNTTNFLSLPFNPNLKDRAKELRKAGNLAEVLFWNQVKNNQFDGLDFDRQKIIGNYIVDFYCSNLNLVIEIDGSSHNDKEDYDALRQEYLESLGLVVFRVTDVEVKNNLDGVLKYLRDFCNDNFIINEEKTTTSTAYVNVGEDKKTTSSAYVNVGEDKKTTSSAYENVGEDKKTTSSDFVSHSSKGGEFEEISNNTFAPIDILDYIYAVLHSPTYRETYKEFLKIDFPRVPYPKDKDTFWKLVTLGGEIRQIHLLESPKVEEYITQYPISGDNKVIKPTYVSGKVYINETQYFDNVPEIAWNFYIGGYQPAQKWLKDRKDRTLDFDDILHYQKIIVALSETHRLMIEIDKIGVV